MPKSASRTRPTRDETIELSPDGVIPAPESAPDPAPPTVHRSHRHPFGAHPVPLLGLVGLVALVTAIVLLAAGAIVGGLVVLMLAVPLLGLFAGGVMREPNAPAASRSIQLIHRIRSLAGFLAAGVRTEGRAGVGLARVRSRQHQLRRELKATMAPLGEAVHRRDQPQADALAWRARKLERELEQLDDEASRLAAAARDRMATERATIQPTRTLRSVPAEPDRR
jgi:hypothetical protein